MSRPNNAIESFLKHLSPDEDTGWEWLRKMHELGYELSNLIPNSFTRGDERVGCELRKGAVAWLAGYKGVENAYVTFADPIAAAVWWETERQNMAPVEQAGQPYVQPAVHAAPMIQKQPQRWLSDEEIQRAIRQGIPPPSVFGYDPGKP